MHSFNPLEKIEQAEQEKVFVEQEADAWFNRNPAVVEPVAANHRVLKALNSIELPSEGCLLDIGGATGSVSAGFLRDHPKWKVRVVEPSAKAIAAGKQAFPKLDFAQGSISQREGMPWIDSDVVIVSGVFCVVDRNVLTQAIANVDAALKNGGLLVISDFDSPSLRANPYKHYPGLFTYKQDYAEIFRTLGTYQLISRQSSKFDGLSSGDISDPYDLQWVTVVLCKDTCGRYFQYHK
jgi:SAM-dependent methyltransferase